MERSDIAPGQEQSYLTVDTDKHKKNDMPHEIQTILGWPISRSARTFSEDGEQDSYWYPYSMEMVVVQARAWYKEGHVPDAWREELMDISPNKEFLQNELDVFLASSYPCYYRCGLCSHYI
jgi:hypothetical protein